MKIRLKSYNFDVVQSFGQSEVNLEASAATLRTLLNELTKRSGGKIELISPYSGQFNEEFIVLINGQEFRNLPQALETELKDGDEVDIGLLYILEGG